jgi:hypothetical protein
VSDVLDRIDRVRVVSWEWNDAAASVGLEPGRREIGVIAQEIADVFPELVTTDDGFQHVNYGSIAAIAIAGIQRLRAELADTRARLARLEATRDTTEAAGSGNTALRRA